MRSDYDRNRKPKACIIVVYLRWRRTCTATGINPRRPSSRAPLHDPMLFRRARWM